MSTGYKIQKQDGVYYLTLQIVGWVDIFSRKVYRDILVDSLNFCKRNKGLEIFAFVIMSNHVHLLVQCSRGALSDVIRQLKSFTAKKMLEMIESISESRRDWMLNFFEFAAKRHKRNEKYQIWTHENHAEEIWSNKFIDQKVEYIHQNPVRAGFVQRAEEYLYSSARAYAGLDCLVEVTIV